MTVHRFIVPGEPVTWKRARRGRGHSYTDPGDAAYRDKIRAHARNAGIRRPLEGAVGLRLRFYRANADDPTSLVTGDLDNLEKAVKDALKGIAYGDDRQVTDVSKRKRIDRAAPRTEVEVGPAQELETPPERLEDHFDGPIPTSCGKDLSKGPP